MRCSISRPTCRGLLYRTKVSPCLHSCQSRRLQPAQAYGNQFEEPAPAPAPDGEQDPESAAAPREDDVLPDNLMDSLRQGAAATTLAIDRGIQRSIVEILLPEFWDPMSGPVFSEEGDQMRFWTLGKRFCDDLIEMTGSKNVTVVFPDIGVASYLKNAWAGDGMAFEVGSLNDRLPLRGEEDLVVLVSPDPPGADDVIRVNRMVPAEVPMVLFNPRLFSGDVGIGLNVRRMRNQFLAQFITTYSIRPIGDIGTIFRRYPDLWQVFVQDEKTPGRYRIIAERPERPAGDTLDYILEEALGGGGDEDGQGGNPLGGIARTVGSLNRFMKSLSN
eukprot:jgi/Ulvmu1/2292/UM013_0139.1